MAYDRLLNCLRSGFRKYKCCVGWYKGFEGECCAVGFGFVVAGGGLLFCKLGFWDAVCCGCVFLVAAGFVAAVSWVCSSEKTIAPLYIGQSCSQV